MDIERIFIRTNTKDNKNDIYETSSEYISSDEKNKDKKFIKKNKQPVSTNNNINLNKAIIIKNQNLVIIKK
jgi:hypothetical protein